MPTKQEKLALQEKSAVEVRILEEMEKKDIPALRGATYQVIADREKGHATLYVWQGNKSIVKQPDWAIEFGRRSTHFQIANEAEGISDAALKVREAQQTAIAKKVAAEIRPLVDELFFRVEK